LEKIMNINYKEAQFELFPNVAKTAEDPSRPHFMAAWFNLSIENLVIFAIVSIMVVIFAFSLGVERGKRIAMKDPAPAVVDARSAVQASVADPAAGTSTASSVEAVKPLGSDLVTASGKFDAGKAAAESKVKDPSARPSSGYTVQVASYKSGKRAEKEAQALLKKGYKAFVLSRGQHVVLCVGNFQKREDAGIFGKKLKSNYQDFVVRRL
jgi:cell division septation protein DedD